MVKLITNKIMKTNTFIAMLQSFTKHFVTIILAEFMLIGDKLFSMDTAMLLTLSKTALLTCLPIAYNYFNPNYKQYGGSKEPLKPIKRK